MQIGQVIRKYRKDKNMTQEEMAGRLGVTAPAVNKWENGNSYPDITLLPPIARLLGISLDTLLSFHEDLTQDEIKNLIYEMDSRLKEESYGEVFDWAKQVICKYPNCEQLILQMAAVLDAQRLFHEVPDAEAYDGYIYGCYVRVLDSADEDIRRRAADSLFGYYMRKEQYDRAEECLVHFSKQNPERKRKQAELYGKTNRISEAHKAYEELLFETYQMASMAFHGIYLLALQEKDMEKAHRMVEKEAGLAGLFEWGRYSEVSCRLELAAVEQDAETAVSTMENMLACMDTISGFLRSPLYSHMAFSDPSQDFLAGLKENLLECFRDEESFGFLKENKRWQKLTEG